MAFTIGYNGVVTINAATLCVTKWSVNEKVDEIDVTTTCDNGFVKYIPGAADCDITLEGILGTGATEDPANVLGFRALGDIRIGSTASISISPDASLNVAASWSFPFALVTGWNMESAPRDTVKWTLMAKGKTGAAGNGGNWVEPNL